MLDCRRLRPWHSAPGDAARRASRARAATAGSTGCRRRGLRPCAGPSCAARSAARTDMPSTDDPRRASFCALLVVRDREHRTGVALGQLAALDHPSTSSGSSSRRTPVRDRRLRAADPLGDARRGRARTRPRARRRPRASSTGREILARDVLDEAEEQRVAVVRLADERGHRRQAGVAGGAPAALAGDQLVAALRRAGARRPAARRPARGSSSASPAIARGRSAGAAGAGSAWIASTGSWASSVAAVAPPISTSRPRPRPLRGWAQPRSTSSIATFQ